ncbi:MAG: hypothetical protein FD188_3247 [Ignavibacteria bacterium]|nr:MAG: hypothetical protein FD188_3247 [Ignavibacteria bacterium]
MQIAKVFFSATDSNQARFLTALEQTDIQQGGARIMHAKSQAIAFKNTLINIDITPTSNEKVRNIENFSINYVIKYNNKLTIY